MTSGRKVVHAAEPLVSDPGLFEAETAMCSEVEKLFVARFG